MEVKELNGIEIGDTVRILVGPFKNRIRKVVKIEENAGAKNGWFTVDFGIEGQALFAGEEIQLIIDKRR